MNNPVPKIMEVLETSFFSLDKKFVGKIYTNIAS